EPTAGIDPVARRSLWDLLFDLVGMGKTLFVTTHYMDEAERCSEIAYIYMSKLMVRGTPAELKKLPEVCPPHTRRLSVESENPPMALMALKKAPFVIDATLVESEVHLVLDVSVTDDEVRKAMSQAGIDAVGIRPVDPSLEDVFVALTKGLASR
ncbi:MAG: ABC transporter ATP-binding protein, partial [Thaumarchaeota archaeon]|nr:ABC transporter ATP-binding protein [Nitrososphaerota archaeon]